MVNVTLEFKDNVLEVAIKIDKKAQEEMPDIIVYRDRQFIYRDIYTDEDKGVVVCYKEINEVYKHQ